MHEKILFGSERIFDDFFLVQILRFHHNGCDPAVFISFVIQRSLGGVDAAGVDGLIIFSVRREHAAADDGYGIEQVEQLSYAAGFRVPAYRVVFIKGGSDKARCGGVVAGQADCAKALAKGRQGTYGVISKPILRIFGGEVQILA